MQMLLEDRMEVSAALMLFSQQDTRKDSVKKMHMKVVM